LNRGATSERNSTLYLCGRPGTGKTSTLNYVIESNGINKIASVHCFNAMRFKDVKDFLNAFDEHLCELTDEVYHKQHDITTQLLNVQEKLRKVGGYK
jgi:Holliday junction resolvasome RuvABC ATP-dependent DNA helicase subunit